jgi:hypothetical protein
MLTRFLTRREAALISLDRRCWYSITSIKSSASYTACLASLSHFCTAGLVIYFSSASSRSPLRVFSVSFNFPRRPSIIELVAFEEAQNIRSGQLLAQNLNASWNSMRSNIYIYIRLSLWFSTFLSLLIYKHVCRSKLVYIYIWKQA